MTCSVENCTRSVSAKGWCKMHYERMRRYGKLEKYTPPPPQPCSVEGCEKPSRSSGRDGAELLCKMHYHRQYRHRDVTRTAHNSGVNRPTTQYRRVPCPGHPLASKNGDAWEHRVILYDKIGPGPHSCHHCGTRIVWFVVDPKKNDPRLIYVDHLDDDRGNNDPANLVESCYRCNISRGHTRRREALKKQGWWSGKDTLAGSRTSPFEA